MRQSAPSTRRAAGRHRPAGGSRWAGAVALLALLAGACSPTPRPTDEPVDHAARLARIEADVEPAVALEGIERDPATLAERMAHLGVPALSVALWSGGEIVWARAWGLADVASGRPATPDTLFQAASISKPVAAMGLLALAEEGLVRLDEDVNLRLTSWQVPSNELTAGAPVTLRGLLSHTAGTTVHGFPGYPRDAVIPSTVGVLDGTGNTDPVRVDVEPRTVWRYSGGGYTVAQLLAADATGRGFAELLRGRVLAPLGMTASTFEQPLPEARWPEAATAYRAGGAVVDGGWHVYPEMAAAGLWTTPSDLARFAISIQRARAGEPHPVLDRETIDAMLERHLGNYGLGLSLLGEGAFFGHGGSNEGFRATLVAELDGDGGVAMMTNSDRGGALNRELLYTVAREEGWDAFEPPVKKVVTLAPDKLAALAGRYSTEGPPGAVTVYLEDGQIWGRSEWDGEAARLLAESESLLFDAEDGMEIRVVWRGDQVRMLEVSGLEFRRVEP